MSQMIMSNRRGISQQVKNYLKEYATDNIESVLEDLGVQYQSHGGNCVGRCPVHGGDNHSAFSFSEELGVWACFTRGCQRDVGNDVIGLIRGVTGRSFGGALSYIKELFSLDENDAEKFSEYVLRPSMKRLRVKVGAAKGSLDKSLLDKLEITPAVKRYFFEQRGFRQVTFERARAGAVVNKDSRWHNYCIFPCFSTNDDLIGWSARFVGETAHQHRWRTYGNRDAMLYGASWLRPEDSFPYIVVVEGALKVLRLKEAGVLNAVATLGCSLSRCHLEMLLGTGHTKIGICYDGDKAGGTGAERALASKGDVYGLSRYFATKNIDVGDFEDLDKMTTGEIKQWIVPQLSSFVST